MAMFGTDGIRGLANAGHLTPESVLQIGRAIGVYTRQAQRGRPCVVIGRDTRISGDVLVSALSAGLCSTGVDVIDAGVVPTPAIPTLISFFGSSAGIAVTASHNPFGDNGLKVFDANSRKISEDTMSFIEVASTQGVGLRPTGRDIGCVSKFHQALQVYTDHVTKTVGPFEAARDLSIALDCANGAAHRFGPHILRNMGLRVREYSTRPDGLNINTECGATCVDSIIRAVKSGDADIGIAFDGDADRCVLVDEHGVVLDGDHVLAILGIHMRSREQLTENTVVATVMSNIGLSATLSAYGIDVVRAKVGDRFVAEKMLQVGASLGGEKSGHTIIQQNSVGDGIITALSVLNVMSQEGRSLHDLGAQLTLYPQKLVNVEVSCKVPIQILPRTQKAIQEAEIDLGAFGDVLVRYSGTENLARVMVQGECPDAVNFAAQNISDTLSDEVNHA